MADPKKVTVIRLAQAIQHQALALETITVEKHKAEMYESERGIVVKLPGGKPFTVSYAQIAWWE